MEKIHRNRLSQLLMDHLKDSPEKLKKFLERESLRVEVEEVPKIPTIKVEKLSARLVLRNEHAYKLHKQDLAKASLAHSKLRQRISRAKEAKEGREVDVIKWEGNPDE